MKEKAKQVIDPERKLRQDIEEAIEQAAGYVHDATDWWSTEDQGPRLIDTLVGMLVVAAKRYAESMRKAI